LVQFGGFVKIGFIDSFVIVRIGYIYTELAFVFIARMLCLGFAEFGQTFG